MTERPNPYYSHFEKVRPLLDFANRAHEGLDAGIAELIKIRASQLNGCAACLYMHTRDARRAGESEERMHLLGAWRETPLFSARERAALAWTETLTLVASTPDTEAAYADLAAQFSDEEMIGITLLIGAINAFNRLNAGFAVPYSISDASEAA